MVLGLIVAQVSDAGMSVDEELPLACAVADPIKAHVDRFRSFLLDGVVVDLDWRGRMVVPQFTE